MKNSKPVSLHNTESFILSSSAAGDHFEINLALPDHYREDRTYPVLYLTDSNVLFGLVTDTVRLLQFGREIPDLIIVGIGYPDRNRHMKLRERDLLPGLDRDVNETGRADRFLTFITEELMPRISSHYSVDSDESVLAGDSFGGLFSLYALFSKPEVFSRYIIGSPSLYWGGSVMFDYEKQYAAGHDDLKATVFLSAGEREAHTEPESACMLSNVARLIEILSHRNYSSLQLKTHLFPGETHLSVIPGTFSRGLKEVFYQTSHS